MVETLHESIQGNMVVVSKYLFMVVRVMADIATSR